MRIAVLANAASVHTGRWAGALAQRGHEVRVLSIREGDIPGVEVERVGIGRSGSPNPVAAFLSYLRLLVGARRRLRHFDPDVVHAHYATTHGVIAGWRSSAPVVLTVWGSDVMRGDRPVRRPLRNLVRFAARRAVAVTSASEAMARVVRSLSGVDPEIVRFGVDVSRFASQFDGTASSDEPFTIGFLKGLSRRYGPDVLIAAMPRIVKRWPDARLLVGGDGPMRPSLEQAAAETGVADSISFEGRIDPADVPEFLARIDLLVNPSRSESFGVVLLEAAAAGVPVVATDVGGVREAVVAGETALLVPPDNAAALAEAVIALAADPDRREHMGRVAFEMARSRHRWETSVDRMERILLDAAAGAAA